MGSKQHRSRSRHRSAIETRPSEGRREDGETAGETGEVEDTLRILALAAITVPTSHMFVRTVGSVVPGSGRRESLDPQGVVARPRISEGGRRRGRGHTPLPKTALHTGADPRRRESHDLPWSKWEGGGEQRTTRRACRGAPVQTQVQSSRSTASHKQPERPAGTSSAPACPVQPTPGERNSTP
ncbi:hypothetical protein CALCODRAFT_122818 [Calocera cornea HHB12733]|uniref:Uncharacterized protein n=1 Tax=Calocera cornea HHB12733 TaxID=1353952 RepID=A0A165CYA0_9BASI|nr:hypothetical protein CALCODRAFT_122818 [Calocera cornea HHB12733]